MHKLSINDNMAPHDYTHHLRGPDYEVHYLSHARSILLISQPDLDIDLNRTLPLNRDIARPHSVNSQMTRIIADLRTKIEAERRRYTKHMRGCSVEQVCQTATETVLQKDVEVVRARTQLANEKALYQEFQ